MPGRDLHGLSRASVTIPVKPVHEALLKELEESPLLVDELKSLVDAKALPRSYYAHPLVQENPGEQLFPYELYLDGVPYSLVDSVVGVWAKNCLSGNRHLCALIRKRTCCKCGCKGWCSFYDLHTFLHWCCEALYDGVWPAGRHDGQPWKAEDHGRQAKAGERMPFKMLLLYIKADWAEMCERFGFPTWQSSTRPCLSCACTQTLKSFARSGA